MLNAISGRLASGGLDSATQEGLAMNYLDQVIIAQANILGFQDGFVALTMIGVIPLIPVLLLLRKKR
jgi:hypothetical protein